MKLVIAHKFCLKHGQNGVVLLFTMFLLLIIAILTMAFHYLQFFEVDLIASETDYLQAFYMANTGLEQGIKDLEEKENRDVIQMELERSPDHTYDPGRRIQISLVSNKEGTVYWRYYLDPNHINRISIVGTGLVNNTKRQIQYTWEVLSKSTSDFPEQYQRDLVEKLDYAVVTFTGKANFPDLLIPPTIEKVDIAQPKILTKYPDDRKLSSYDPVKLSPEQIKALKSFEIESKRKIAKVRLINENDNELLFPEGTLIRENYYKPSLVITPRNCEDLPFDYTDKNRKTQGGRTLIEPSMTLKKNQRITLKGGTYFFGSLTLKEGSTLTTKGGDVQIYVTALKLEKNAKMIGGESGDTNKRKPNDLFIIAEIWDGYPNYDPILRNFIDIGPGAWVAGHIFSKNLDVFLSRGINPKFPTKVFGSILARRFVTYVGAGKQTYTGPIIIKYEQYSPEGIKPVLGSWREVRLP